MATKKAKVVELTPNETAELLGITVNTLYLWRKDKRKKMPLPIVYNPRRIVFIKSELEDWLKENQAKRGAF